MSIGIQCVREYLHALGVVVSPRLWAGGSRLPFFLQDGYRFFAMRLLGIPLLLMEDRQKEGRPPAMIRKHMAHVLAQWDGEVVYVCERVTAYNRKRLIEHKVPFVVPGNQMYLPMLGVDFRERFRKQRVTPARVSPATQALLIHVLLHGVVGGEDMPSAMARRLGYTPMTMTRAYDELESAGLVEVFREARHRRMRLAGSAGDVWVKSRELLRSPVRRRVYTESLPVIKSAPCAGLAALARYSSLAAPATPVVAIGRKEWRLWKQRHAVPELSAQDPDAVEIEVWCYDPALFARDAVIDPLSLYLSLRDTQDARVEMARDEMMEGLTWL